jgi:GNAT superfamily N-acetyltransferase
VPPASIPPVRSPDPLEIAEIARVWYDAWRDAHLATLPEQLIRVRTLDSFHQRLARDLSPVRVIGLVGAPVGLCAIRDDELYQLFVAASARGTGAAQALLADGERRLAANGVTRAWLSCAIGNDRAARFYEKMGWTKAGNMVADLETTEGFFQLESLRYEKVLPHP